MSAPAIALLILFVAAAQALYLVLQVLISKLLRAAPSKAMFGTGPLLLRRRVAGLEVEVRALPVVAAVSYGEGEGILGLAWRVFLPNLLAPWVGLSTVALALGSTPADFGAGVSHLVRVDARLSWEAIEHALLTAPAGSFGRLLAFMVGVNALPLGPMAGGLLVMRSLTPRGRAIYQGLSLLAVLGLVVFLLVR